MKKLTKIAIIGAIVVVIGATSVTALAASAAGSRNMMAGFNNRANAVYGTTTVASEDLEARKAACLDQMKDVLDAKVAAGTMTQTQEDALLNSIKDRQENCLGTGNGYNMMGGSGYGMMGGYGNGYGMMGGSGYGMMGGSGYGMMGGQNRAGYGLYGN